MTENGGAHENAGLASILASTEDEVTAIQDDVGRFDVAFSFLGPDEPLAIELADRLRDRYKVFLYSEQQERLAGGDGEGDLRRVFKDQSRIAVILYRPAWGTTRWTRTEQEGIRDRARDLAYERFALMILLEGPPPDWIPWNVVWLDYQRSSIDTTVGAILMRLRMAGGEARVETAADRAGRLQRDLEWKRTRKHYLNSDEGAQAAEAAALAVLDEVSRLADQITASQSRIPLRVVPSQRGLIVRAANASLVVGRTRYESNFERHCVFHIRVWDGPLRTQDSIAMARPAEPKEVLELDLPFDVDRQMQPRWRQGGTGEPLTSEGLADFAIQRLLDQMGAEVR